jgi:hypothetical protein
MFIYSSTCFGRFPAHHQELNDCSGSLWFYFRIVVIAVLCSWSGRPARPRTQPGCHHDTEVKTEAATAVIELQMMGGKTPETCWAVNKRQDNKLKSCCIWLVIHLNCTMMHGLTNLKLYHLFAPKCIFLQAVILRNALNNSDEYSDAVPPVTSLLFNTATGHISKSHKGTY